MPLANVLEQIRKQITEMAPGLELFNDPSLQATAADCETLQTQLNRLQEHLAVYKYTKNLNELSPSFKIHARISEKEITAEPVKQPDVQMPPVTPAPTVAAAPEKIIQQEAAPEIKTVTPPVSEPQSKIQYKPLSIGLNDKFRFINELFAQNNSEYNIALQQLNTVSSWHEAEVYLNSLKNLYGWNEKNEVLKYFHSVVKKRFE